MQLGVKVGGHATQHLALLPDPAAKGHTLQVALQGVAPLVVGAHKFFAVAMAFAAKLHATMRAYVFQYMHGAIVCARHDDRAFTNAAALVVTRVGNFGLQAHVTPVLVVKKPFQLQLVAVGVGVDAKGNVVGAVAAPVQGAAVGIHGRYFR